VRSRMAHCSGDIVISVDTAVREAQAMKVPLRQRLNWLLIHGLVHLLGYDHERSEAEAILMEDGNGNFMTTYTTSRGKKP